MIKDRLSFVGISSGKYSQQDKRLRGWCNFSVTGQHLFFWCWSVSTIM